MNQQSELDKVPGRPTSMGDLNGQEASGVALLTGGSDRPYVHGLATALMSKGVALDLIGSDELDIMPLRGRREIKFYNLRGNQQSGASVFAKVLRVSSYYLKLMIYAATARPGIFHILWNNKFEVIDRTLLMLYYKLLGKKVVLTLHNVNAAKRDSKDTYLNRLTLRSQYACAAHIFVHTDRMKQELMSDFRVSSSKITVVPFGINNAVPHTSLTKAQARQRLALRSDDKAILFFGNITPYKGLEFLLDAFAQIQCRCQDYKLIIVGKNDSRSDYWQMVSKKISQSQQNDKILMKTEFIPDEDTELYFKAADVLVLPYRYIYQSGVLFLAHSFGLPVLATDVGPFRDEIIEGRTGFICKPEDSTDLASAIERYFASDLYRDLDLNRDAIRDYVEARHSWEVVAQMTIEVYARLLSAGFPKKLDASRADASRFGTDH